MKQGKRLGWKGPKLNNLKHEDPRTKHNFKQTWANETWVKEPPK
jgi:hypothetical protein